MERDDILRIGAPLVAAGTVWLAANALRSGYSKATGNTAPMADDLDAPVMRVFMFALMTAAVTTVIKVGITRGVAKAAHRPPEGLAGAV